MLMEMQLPELPSFFEEILQKAEGARPVQSPYVPKHLCQTSMHETVAIMNNHATT